jgi:ATP/maltotriose-dependent transcriptional regulator MalT
MRSIPWRTNFIANSLPEVQQFYRHAALLTNLNPRAVGALFQTDAAGSYIAALEANQLPLIRRLNNDDYELHGFFREFLSDKLIETEGAERKVGLHVAFAARYEAWASGHRRSSKVWRRKIGPTPTVS